MYECKRVNHLYSLTNINTGRLEIISSNRKRRSHDQIIYNIEQPLLLKNINSLKNIISSDGSPYGMYLSGSVGQQLQGFNHTPYKLKNGGKLKLFNISSFYPRYDESNPSKSVIGQLIADNSLKADRNMVSICSGDNHTNNMGHKDILADYMLPDSSSGDLKLIFFDGTQGIQSDEFVNRFYYGSEEDNDIITEYGLHEIHKNHNHEYIMNRGLIAVKGN